MSKSINGVIFAHKPIGYTSRQVVNHYSKILQTKKIGHTGTLDPFAEGLLILLVGKCTVFQNYFLNFPKTYRATIRLGQTTDTLDCDGNITKTNQIIPQIDLSICEETIKKYFLGKIKQIPPKYSAIKINGKRAYDLARQKKTFDIPERTVEIKNFRIEKIDLDNKTIDTFIECSSGTYIRTLTHDFCQKLGIESHLINLDRITIGEYQSDDFLLTIDKQQINEPVNLKSIDFIFSQKNPPFPIHQHSLDQEKSDLIFKIQNGIFEKITPSLKRGFNIFYWQQKVVLIFTFEIEFNQESNKKTKKTTATEKKSRKWKLLYNNFD